MDVDGPSSFNLYHLWLFLNFIWWICKFSNTVNEITIEKKQQNVPFHSNIYSNKSKKSKSRNNEEFRGSSNRGMEWRGAQWMTNTLSNLISTSWTANSSSSIFVTPYSLRAPISLAPRMSLSASTPLSLLSLACLPPSLSSLTTFDLPRFQLF